MAVVTGVLAAIKTFGDDAHVVTWADILSSGEGSAFEMPGSHIKSVQFDGTFGAGGTIQLHGSNDGTNYVVLTDPQGNTISKTAAAIESISEHTRYVKPVVTAGDGTTSIDVTLFVKRTR